jgi:protein O-mannosyl-transferase
VHRINSQLTTLLNTRCRRVIVCVSILLAALTWIVFGQTLRYDFVTYDDSSYVYHNTKITGGLNIASISWAFTHIHAINWHPLTTITHMLDCQLYGLRAGGHHFSNVLLHTIGVVLLFIVLQRMTGALWRSAFVAAVFAIHPLHVESVAWVSERKDVLSGVFFMLTLLAYDHYARAPSIWRYLTVAFVFGLGLMSKPMLVTLPFVLLLLDYWPLGRIRNGRSAARRQLLRLVFEKILLMELSAVSSVVTFLAQRVAVGSVVEQSPILSRISNDSASYVFYVWQMFWPANLKVTYYHLANLPLWEGIPAATILVGITIAATILRKNAPYLITGWLWYLGMLVPVTGLALGGPAHADRYTYLPQIGLYIAGTWAVVDLAASWRRQRIVLGTAALLVIGVLSWRARIQTSYWRDTETLFRHLEYKTGEPQACAGEMRARQNAHRRCRRASGEVSYCDRSQS